MLLQIISGRILNSYNNYIQRQEAVEICNAVSRKSEQWKYKPL